MNDTVKVELELDRELVALASRAGIDLSAVADRALQRALGPEQLRALPRYAARLDQIGDMEANPERREAADDRARRWREENADAIRASNEELERNGLWSDGYRLF